MNHFRTATLAIALVLAPLGAVPAQAAPLTYSQLQNMATNMGFAPNQVSTGTDAPKFEIQTKAGTFNVPLGLEISSSGRFVWVTANLGVKTLSADQANEILKRGGSVQPTQFWYTSKGNLMIGMAIDNREVTPAYLKFVIDKVGADVVATADIWNK
jgi:hypothetical protein